MSIAELGVTRGTRAIAIFAVLLVPLASAHAQESAVTTALRFAEPPQRVPASVSAFDQLQLDRKGIETMDQLQLQVPSLVAGEAQPSFTLRGVGAGIVGPASEPGFAVRLGGVTASRIDLTEMGFFDLERVEIARGPQGTLYGRNTVGGVMNIVPRRAAGDFESALDFEYGSFSSARVRGVLNAPLADERIALRLAVQHRRHDGFYDQRFADQRAFDRNDTSLRGSLGWQLRSDLRLDFSWTFWRDDGNGFDHKLVGDPRPTGSGGLIGSDDLGAALPSPDSPRAGNENTRQDLDRTVNFGSAALAWDVADFAITLTGGYQSHDFFNSFDADQTELDARTATLFDDVRAWSADVEILFADGGPFRFAFGGGYFDEKNEGAGGDELRTQQSAAAQQHGGLPAGFSDQTQLFATAVNRSAGTFADGSYQMFERLRIRGGIHYSHTHRHFDDRSTSADYRAAPGGELIPVVENGDTQVADWNSLTWRSGVDLDVTADNLVYALLSTGNRPGGFDFLSDAAFKEEEILAIEIGAKNTFCGDRLLWNLAAFHYDFDDIQTRIASPTSGRLVAANIPSASIWGAETDWLVEPLERLLLNGSLGWLDTRYNSDFTTFPGDPCRGGDGAGACPAGVGAADGFYRIDDVSTENLKGKDLSRSPEISLNAGIEYTYELSRWATLPGALRGALTGRFDYTHRAAMYFDTFNRDRFRAGAWNSADLRLIYAKRTAAGDVALEGFARNLWDETVRTNIIPINDGLDEAAFYNQPRTYGFRLTTRWR